MELSYYKTKQFKESTEARLHDRWSVEIVTYVQNIITSFRPRGVLKFRMPFQQRPRYASHPTAQKRERTNT